ncbi:cilia- and flagella-associated protein 58-like [Trachinotus anak]|uniref:cilia- and flagella-associated protein 58-like n=1 Tax=Trachinotus anak TaxID=443729 RepID=UPI0039F19482
MSITRGNSSTGVKSAKSQLIEELHRTQKNEKWLIDQNRDLKRQLTFLVKTETSLKKEQLEVARLKRKGTEQDIRVDKLRNELQKFKADLANEQTQRHQEKTFSEQRIVVLEKKCQEFENKYSVERSLREQKDRELEVYTQIRGEKKKLATELQSLHHQVQELLGYKNFASKTMEEQRQLLKKKDLDHEQTKHELDEVRSEVKKLEDEIGEIIKFKDQNEGSEKEALRRAYQKEKQQILDAHRKRVHQLRKEVRELTFVNEDLKRSTVLMENQVLNIKEINKQKTEELQNQLKEAAKQRNIIQTLEHEVSSYSELKIKIHNQRRKEAAYNVAKDQEIINMRNIITEMESKQRQQMITTGSVQTTRDLAIKNLFKAQSTISEHEKTIETVNVEIQQKTLEINEKNAEFTRIKKAYRSVKNQLREVKRQLTETKMTQETRLASAGKDQMVVKKNLAKVAAEKDSLEKELVHYKELVVKQQQKLDLLETTKASQESTLRENTEEIKLLLLEQKKLKHKCEMLRMKVLHQCPLLKDKKIDFANEFWKASQNRPSTAETKLKSELEEKDKEIKELKHSSDDATLKFRQGRWDNRQLREKVMSLEGRLGAYEKNYQSQSEENKKLTDEVRRLNLEKKEKSRHLPTAPSKPQPPSEEKPESVPTSRRTRFPPVATKSPCQSENKSQIVHIPLLRGKQIRPHLSLDTMSTQPQTPSGLTYIRSIPSPRSQTVTLPPIN